MFCAFLGHTGERLQDHWSSGYEDLTKIIFQLSSNTHLISSSDTSIMLICPCDLDFPPQTPLLYSKTGVKLGFTGV